MYRQKHRQLGSGSASTQREKKRRERGKNARYFWESADNARFVVCVCLQTNVVLFRFSESTLNKLKFVLFRENFRTISRLQLDLLNWAKYQRECLSLSLVHTRARSLSLSLSLSWISYFTWSWGLRFRGYYGLCFAQLFRAPISIGYAHTSSSSKKATLRWRRLRQRRDAGVAVSSTQN